MTSMSVSCADILAGRAPADTSVTLKGWVRTRRDSKAGISFVHLSDGSAFHPVQVVAPNTLPNYADEVLHLTAGCSLEATGHDRALAGQGTAVRDAGNRGQSDRLGRRPRLLSDPTQAAFARVPARGRPPATAHQRDRRRHPRAPHDRAGDPWLLRRTRIHVGQHADHHRVGCGRRRRTVSRLDARPDESAAHAARQSRLCAGLLRARDVSHRLRSAQRRDVLHGACPRCTRSGRRFAPRTPTPAVISPNSG